MWPMVEARAWSRHRARGRHVTVGTVPQDGDVTIKPLRPPQGSFFKFQQFALRPRRFNQTWSDPLVREAFFGIDAVVVLPYDPDTDRVAMVEQVRLAPVLRDDPNPWLIEPVAGIVDARETPADCARRECQEEAGLDGLQLHPAGQFYASPGASTDYFYTYVACCALPEPCTYPGGLPEEGEDLRVHVMPFDQACAMADSGEIATAPALHLIYWLLRHKASLRTVPVS